MLERQILPICRWRPCLNVRQLSCPQKLRTMATVAPVSVPHELRTVAEPRENKLEPVILSHIHEVNDNIRLLRLQPVDPNHTIHVRCFASNRYSPHLVADREGSKVLTRPMA
jgi:hypothetical protein